MDTHCGTVCRFRSNNVDNTCDGRRSTGELGHALYATERLAVSTANAREAARRAGPSATVGTCFLVQLHNRCGGLVNNQIKKGLWLSLLVIFLNR